MTTEPDRRGSRRRLRGPWWFTAPRHLTEEQRRDVLAQLFFEGEDRAPFLSRFAALLVFALLVAVCGLAADSIAVVIGAMLISPLTTPILGLATALIHGWSRRIAEAGAILIAGSVAGAGLAFVALLVLPEPAAITLSSEELIARTEPSLLDLVVAIVAGGAGAYVLVRQEAVGALPGVAIAVALVPPLATVGMMLELGEPARAGEAALLYLTNLAGIVLASGVVLLIAGVRPELVDGRLPRGARFGVASAALAVVAIAVPLAVLTTERVSRELDEQEAARVLDDWAEGDNLRVTDIDVGNDAVRAAIAGFSVPRDVDVLADRLSAALGRPVEVKLGWTRELRLGARP